MSKRRAEVSEPSGSEFESGLDRLKDFRREGIDNIKKIIAEARKVDDRVKIDRVGELYIDQDRLLSGRPETDLSFFNKKIEAEMRVRGYSELPDELFRAEAN